MIIPSINYRFGDKWLITDFVTPQNPDVQHVLIGFGGILVVGDDLVKVVAEFVRDNFEYPMVGDTPSADGQLLRYMEGLFKHKFKDCEFYVWAFPAEVLQSHLGYCAETGNLAESLLIGNIKSLAVLGDVLSAKDDTLLGRHEWVETPYKGSSHVLETTIHTKGANNLAETTSVYDKESDWAKQGGIYYVPRAWFNDKMFKGDDQLITLMSLPAKRVLLFGLEETQKVKAKKLAKEFHKEDQIKENLIRLAWGG